jgi:ABC-2 type transport system ATP-binding protein
MVVKAPLIEIKNLTKEFNGKQVLSNISFNIMPGQIFGIIGQSGAGKTTLMRTLVGFYKADKGSIIFRGKNIRDDIKYIRSIFGFCTQENAFYEELTVMENMRYFGRLYGLQNKLIEERIEELLKLVELFEHRNKLATEISGGMKRRLDLACALIHRPHVLILDEPTTGLDPLLKKHMWTLIKRINQIGTTIVISTHLMEEVEVLCNDVAIISNGKLLVVGTTDQLKNWYSRNEEIHLETYPGRYQQIVKALKSYNLPIPYVTHEGHKVIIYTPYAERVLHYIIHVLEEMNERLLDVDVNKPSLNEVFEALTKRQR